MGILHLVYRSPGETLALAHCLDRAGKGDAVLLLESGVYGALKAAKLASRLTEAMPTISFYALAPDLAARGIAADEILGGVGLVDYAGFVELSVMYNPIVSWA